jgi:hypothetical protein
MNAAREGGASGDIAPELQAHGKIISVSLEFVRRFVGRFVVRGRGGRRHGTEALCLCCFCAFRVYFMGITNYSFLNENFCSCHRFC